MRARLGSYDRIRRRIRRLHRRDRCIQARTRRRTRPRCCKLKVHRRCRSCPHTRRRHTLCRHSWESSSNRTCPTRSVHQRRTNRSCLRSHRLRTLDPRIRAHMPCSPDRLGNPAHTFRPRRCYKCRSSHTHRRRLKPFRRRREGINASAIDAWQIPAPAIGNVRLGSGTTRCQPTDQETNRQSCSNHRNHLDKRALRAQRR